LNLLLVQRFPESKYESRVVILSDRSKAQEVESLP